MKMKNNPEHVKRFNLRHAIDGAPYATRNLREAHILKFNARGAYRLIGYYRVDSYDEPLAWNGLGEFDAGKRGGLDLVMTPIAYVQGKPVFTGDRLIDDGGNIFIVPPREASFIGFSWPDKKSIKKKIEYPSVTNDDLNGVDHHFKLWLQNDVLALEYANGVIRRAIDIGKVLANPGYKPKIKVERNGES